jgi:drug/metabolite transporter (DMT)-like permease
VPATTHLERRALVVLLIGAFCIGFAPIFIRLSPVGPAATVAWRLVFAFPFFALAEIWNRRGAEAPRADCPGIAWPWLLLPGMLFFADTLLWTWAIHYTTVSNATLLTNLAPVFVTLWAWWFHRERVGTMFLVALALSLAGTVALMGQSFQIDHRVFAGDGVAALSALFYAGYQISLVRLRRNHSTALLMAYGCVGGAFSAWLTALAAGQPMLWPGAAHDPSGWLPLIGLALLAHVCGQAFVAYAFAHLPASFTSLTLLIQPVVAAGAAWLILKERLGPGQIVGGGIVLAGIVLARFAGARPGQPLATPPKEESHA